MTSMMLCDTKTIPIPECSIRVRFGSGSWRGDLLLQTNSGAASTAAAPPPGSSADPDAGPHPF